MLWKILDAEGRVHMEGRGPMPDFAAGQGLVVSLNMEIAEGDLLAGELEKLPVDSSVVEGMLGKVFASALIEDREDPGDESSRVL